MKTTPFFWTISMALVAACSSAGQSDQSAEVVDTPAEVTENPEKVAKSDSAQTSQTKQDEPSRKYEFSFWYAGESEFAQGLAEPDPTSEFGTHPCGVVRKMEVSSIPDFKDDPDHSTDRAIEYDSNGDTVRRWRLPADQLIAGVREDMLLISHHDEKLLGIRPDGEIVETGMVGQRHMDLKPETCPASISKAFAPSDYLVCSKVADIKSGEVRILAFEAPCT